MDDFNWKDSTIALLIVVVAQCISMMIIYLSLH